MPLLVLCFLVVLDSCSTWIQFMVWHIKLYPIKTDGSKFSCWCLNYTIPKSLAFRLSIVVLDYLLTFRGLDFQIPAFGFICYLLLTYVFFFLKMECCSLRAFSKTLCTSYIGVNKNRLFLIHPAMTEFCWSLSQHEQDGVSDLSILFFPEKGRGRSEVTDRGFCSSYVCRKKIDRC